MLRPCSLLLAIAAAGCGGNSPQKEKSPVPVKPATTQAVAKVAVAATVPQGPFEAAARELVDAAEANDPLDAEAIAAAVKSGPVNVSGMAYSREYSPQTLAAFHKCIIAYREHPKTVLARKRLERTIFEEFQRLDPDVAPSFKAAADAGPDEVLAFSESQKLTPEMKGRFGEFRSYYPIVTTLRKLSEKGIAERPKQLAAMMAKGLVDKEYSQKIVSAAEIGPEEFLEACKELNAKNTHQTTLAQIQAFRQQYELHKRKYGP